MAKSSKTLLIINYSMSENHPIFSHCVDIVVGLSEHFNQIHVITLGESDTTLPDNVTVVALGAETLSKFLKYVALARAYLTFLRRERNHVLFSHMAEKPFFFLAPISKMLKNRTFLWYAHTSKSWYLFLSYPFTSSYITSTKGSFPYKFHNVFYIGQGISVQKFQFQELPLLRISRFIHVGRNDPSKNIDLLIDFFSSLMSRQLISKSAKLILLGNTSSNFHHYKYALDKKINSLYLNENCIFEKGVPRTKVINFLREADVFLHGFLGSLDKSLLEATLCGIPVVSCNREYLDELGSWNKAGSLKSSEKCQDILLHEFQGLILMNSTELKEEIRRRKDYVQNTHNLEDWLLRLALILEDKK